MTIRRLMTATGIATIFGFAAATATLAGTTYSDSIVSGGVTRTFLYFEPSSLGTTARPLVIALHGSNGSASGMQDNVTEFRFDELAETDKWLVAYPDGTEVDGKGRWNDCRITSNNPTTDDVLFISDLIDYFEANYNIDSDRIYVAGHSNGSMMAHRLALELSDRIAAIAGTTGGLAEDTTGNNECGGAVNPTPVIYEAGTDDPVIPYAGGTVSGADLRAQEDTVAFWVGANGTSTTPTTTSIPDTVTTDNTTITKYAYSGGTEGSEVIYYKATGGGHAWPGPTQFGALKIINNGYKPQDIVFADEAWAFFSNHTLGSTGGGGGPLLSDNFEDGNLTGWTTSGTVVTHSGAAYEGSLGARLSQTASMTASIALGGAGAVDFSFAYKTANLDAGESLKAEYRLDAGSWTTLGSASTTSWNTVSYPITTSGASTLDIRFSLNASGSTERGFIDAVLVE
ncbi:MAG: hypothetical protein HXY25_10065 [Alphaproteobacteria bacterium]|nr:hypothetical protein [Alphaproteobacteria bacterium]